MTPYTAAHLARKEGRVKRKCKNNNRIGVEHAFAEIKDNSVFMANFTPTLITTADNMCGACVPKET